MGCSCVLTTWRPGRVGAPPLIRAGRNGEETAITGVSTRLSPEGGDSLRISDSFLDGLEENC